LNAKINPDTDLKRIAFSGAHDATVAAVAGGKVDAGALNISVWEKLVEAGKADPKTTRVFYTTPGYYDYNWSVHASMARRCRRRSATPSWRSTHRPRRARKSWTCSAPPGSCRPGRELQGDRSGGEERRPAEVIK
jgi:hypothetical protein